MFKSKKFKVAVAVLLVWYIYTSPNGAAASANKFINMLEQGGNSTIQFFNGLSVG